MRNAGQQWWKLSVGYNWSDASGGPEIRQQLGVA